MITSDSTTVQCSHISPQTERSRRGEDALSVALLPVPRVPIAIRLATMEDFPAIDALQKKFNKALSFFPQEQFEGYIEKDGIRVAESCPSPLAPCPSILGYVISQDRYLKRDELGVIYQLCVAPGEQRKLVGAALVREVFEKSAYGCKLYCLWCAQDLEANHFWESMGFVPIAFRAGSEKKRRVHIFCEKRIREGDTTTQYWFPSQTGGGAMREDRLVFPIPPGTHWSDAKPIVLPRDTHARDTQQKQIEDGAEKAPRKIKPKVQIFTKRQPLSGGLVFASAAPVKVEKPKPEKKPKIKNDPKFVSAARELRDRWLEKVNTGEYPLPEPGGKYQICKQIESTPGKEMPLLPNLAA